MRGHDMVHTAILPPNPTNRQNAAGAGKNLPVAPLPPWRDGDAATVRMNWHEGCIEAAGAPAMSE